MHQVIYRLTLSALSALLIGVACTVARATPSEKMPRRGYKVVLRPYEGPLALIGRRANSGSGEKTALRMLSRLLRQYPRASSFEVQYSILRRGGREVPASVSYYADKGERLQEEVTLKYLTEVTYYNVKPWMVYHTSRQSLTLDGLMRYGAIKEQKVPQPPLGIRPSVAEGSRASVRALAQLIQQPAKDFENQPCLVMWGFLTPAGEEVDVLIHYRSDLTSLTIETQPLSQYLRGRNYWHVTNQMILRVARRSGTWGDLQKCGATEG